MAKYGIDNFINPYGFIPLGEREKGPERRTYQKDQYTGYISYKLKTESSLFIPNTSNDKAFQCDDDKHKRYDFFSPNILEAGKIYENEFFEPVIPGSEVRGVIRSIYETLTDSCIHQMNGDVVMGKRTVEYFKPGVIIRDENKYKLYEASSQKDEFLINPEEDGKALDANHYIMYGEPGPTKKSVIPGRIFSRGREVKKYVVLEKDLDELLDVISQYQKNASKSDEDNIKEKKPYEAYRVRVEAFINDKENKIKGIPVYYSELKVWDNVSKKSKEERIMLSPACITREVYRNTPKKLIQKYNSCGTETEEKEAGLCPACALFGLIGKGEISKGSRVRFTDLTLVEKADDFKEYYDEELYVMPELSQPKLANTEFYLKKPQDVDGEVWFWTYDYYTVKKPDGTVIVKAYNPEISGRKYYWHGEKVKSCAEKNKRNKTVRTVKKGVEFQGRIYFEEIDETQLKQLCYIISFAGDGEHGYKIGGGKPIGLGSVSLELGDVFCRKFENEKYMESKYTEREKSWEKLGFPAQNQTAFERIMRILPKEEASKVRYPGMKTEDSEGFQWFMDNKKNHRKRDGKMLEETAGLPRERIQTQIVQELPPIDAKFPPFLQDKLQIGEIKKVFSNKRFGYIKRENQPDLWFHFDSVKNGQEGIQSGKKVQYEESTTEKGERAVNIKLIK